MKYDLVIVGGGPAGLAAAVEAKEKGVDSILIIERENYLGGILLQCIHNGFGLHYFKEELTGPEYVDRFVKKAKELKIESKTDTMVIEITKDKKITAVNSTDGLMEICAGAVILAMGCRERTRGAINIPGTRPAGIFTAGTAQKYVNIDGYQPGKKVVILGSGDIGLIMARRMTLEGAEVKLVCEVMPYSGGLNRNIVQCIEDYGIPLQFSHTITKIHGNKRVEGVTVSEVDGSRKPIKGTEKFYECDTLLLSVGLIPENELSKGSGLEMNMSTGGPVVSDSMQTSVKGIFACGNAVHVHDLVDFVTMEGQKSGRNAAIYLKGQSNRSDEKVFIKPGSGVRYCVPNYISGREECGDLEIFFRSDDVYRDIDVVVSDNKNKLTSSRKLIVTPGEMQVIKIGKELIRNVNGNLAVELKKGRG